MHILSKYISLILILCLANQLAKASDAQEIVVSEGIFAALKYTQIRNPNKKVWGVAELKVFKVKILKDNKVSENEEHLLQQFKSGTVNFIYSKVGYTGEKMSNTVNVSIDSEGIAFLETIVPADNVSDMELLWRQNDSASLRALINIADKNDIERQRVDTFLAGKFYENWHKRTGIADYQPFKSGLSRVNRQIFDLKGDEYARGKQLLRRAILLCVEKAKNDNSGSIIPPYLYNPYIK